MQFGCQDLNRYRLGLRGKFATTFGHATKGGRARAAKSAAAPGKHFCNTAALCLIAATAVSAVTEDIGGFGFTFAVCAAIVAVCFRVTTATWMGALLLSFHTRC